MDKNGSVIVLFVVFVIVFGPSDAFNSMKLVTISDPNQDSSSSPPPPPGKPADLTPAPKPKDEPAATGSDSESKGLKSSDKKPDTVKDQDGKGSETFANESCNRNPVCIDQGKTMKACVQDFANGSNNLTLIVKNEQDVELKVNITLGTSNNYSQTFELPAHATEKVNVTFSGDKSNKVILNAGNGDCELQISQLSPVSSVNNTADNPADTPAKPKDVENPTDTPAKPKVIDNPADTPTKPKDVDNPTPAKPTDVDHPGKSKSENDPLKSKDDNTPAKPEDVNSPPKSKDGDDLSKAKDIDGQSKSKEADDPTQSKSKDVDDSSKSTPTSFNAPVSKNNVFDQLTFYSKQVTPMHGAYVAFLVALVIGGSWALCSIRKRRTGGGVPYQELEMGPSEPSNAVDVEIAEGWEQDWDDDDWDEDKAIRSPGGSNHAKTISSNGLTSRATKKDDWDANWDD